MLTLRLILMAVALGAPLVTWGTMAIKQKMAVSAAVQAERRAQETVCRARITELEARHNAQVGEAARDAAAAGDAVRDPATDKELQDICQRSASCRDRGRS